MPSTQILLSAGEASGDMYAAQLAAALKTRVNCEIFGMGGDQMRAANVDVITDYSEVSVLGITEILGHLPQLIRAMRRLVHAASTRSEEHTSELQSRENLVCRLLLEKKKKKYKKTL